MLDLPALRAQFRVQQARYEKLAHRVEVELVAKLRESGVYADVTSRAKEEPNFIRKALKKQAEDTVKHADPLSSIKDRAGVRAIVLHHDGAEEACHLIRASFDVIEFEDTRDRLRPHELGYLGRHFLVTLKPTNLDDEVLDLEGLVCEVQVHTKAENAWSSVSHPMLYKPVAGPTSPRIARQVTRAVALIELFDEEIMRARNELQSEPGYGPAAMLTVLEAEFLRVSPRDFDPELSMQVLRGVEDAYTEDELRTYRRLLDDYLKHNRSMLEALLARYENDFAAHPLLFQPELLAIHERLIARPEQLKTTWLRDSPFDIQLLDSLRDVLGR